MSTENKATAETFKFQAEIQKVLDILINRLYKNREIFLRELISNAADALHRFRIKRFEGSEKILDSDEELAIHILFDEDEKTISVIDNGLGMDYEEIIENLGTIAQSGTLEFFNQLEKSTDAINLIGQFGVGFYSSFIVSNEVVVRSRSYKEDAQGLEWKSEGTGEFTVSPYEKSNRGTEVILHLKEDANEFLNKFKLEGIIKKYSDFVGFPIRVGDDEKIINRQTPIWHQAADSLEDKDYNEFYQQISMDFSEPLHRIHFSVDAPIQFRALLFLPSQKNRMMMTNLYSDYGLRLYSKKILVQEKAKDLLPEYLRFVVGVVDSEDLPLNVSREVIQVDRSIRRISKALTSKVLDELEKVADDDENKYLEWWEQFGVFIKEGLTSDQKRKQKLLKHLRIYTSKSTDKQITLDQYLENMPEEQEEIFYLLGENLDTLKRSPHLEHYNKLDLEVILFNEPVDTFVMTHITEYRDKKFKLVDQAEPEPDSEEEKEEEGETKKKEPEKDKFLSKMLEILGDRVIDVRYTDLLSESPCRLVSPSGTGTFTRMLKYMDENYVPQKKILEINRDHPLIKGLDPKSPRFPLQTFMLLEGQELLEGTLQNPTDMVSRIHELMMTNVRSQVQQKGKGGKKKSKKK
ncbi:MAG: molecular chaperone HtpG [Candidatus Heimdallarchaeota archaeon]